jgi:hypothetical protein
MRGTVTMSVSSLEFAIIAEMKNELPDVGELQRYFY